MIPKPVDEINKSDIETLVDLKTAERRTLDYKELLPGNTDEEKKEFLYDASSFANAAGGDLIFGVKATRRGWKTHGDPRECMRVADFEPLC